MADIRLAYDTSFNATITLANLVFDVNLLQGRESAAITNSSGYLDYLISGKITNGTSPGAGVIEVWAVGSVDGTTWPDVFDGTDSAETVSSTSVKNEVCKLVSSIANYNVSSYAQYFGPISLASIFGGTLPKKATTPALSSHQTANPSSTPAKSSVAPKKMKILKSSI